MRAAFLKSPISFFPPEMMTFPLFAAKKARILAMSASVSAAPFWMLMVSCPMKAMFSLSARGAILVLTTSEMTLPSLSSMMRSP